MKFTLTHSSSQYSPTDEEGETIEINSLEELIALGQKEGKSLIITVFPQTTPEIEVYDSYRE